MAVAARAPLRCTCTQKRLFCTNASEADLGKALPSTGLDLAGASKARQPTAPMSRARLRVHLTGTAPWAPHSSLPTRPLTRLELARQGLGQQRAVAHLDPKCDPASDSWRTTGTQSEARCAFLPAGDVRVSEPARGTNSAHKASLAATADHRPNSGEPLPHLPPSAICITAETSAASSPNIGQNQPRAARLKAMASSAAGSRNKCAFDSRAHRPG